MAERSAHNSDVGTLTAHGKLLVEQQRLQALAAQLIESQEAERSRLASELQHELAQHLSVLKLHLELAGSGAPPASLAQHLGEARVLVDRMIAWVRGISLELRPPMLDDLGLLPTVLWYVDLVQSETGVHCRLQHRGVDRRFPSALETAAFRLLQELLGNVTRHARTTEANLRLWADELHLGLQVEDAGVGFDPEEAESQSPGRGLLRSRERVAWLGGTFTVEARPGRGTKVTIELPLHSTEGAQSAT